MFTTHFHTPRDTWTLIAYIMIGILKKYIKALFSSFLPSYTKSRYHICSHYDNDFRKFIINHLKVSRVTPGYYGRPLRNVKIIFSFYVFPFCPGVTQGLFYGPAKKSSSKKNLSFFPQYIPKVFIRFWKTLQFPSFLLLPILVHIPFLCFFVVSNHV